MLLKGRSKKKLTNLNHKEISIQPYLTMNQFSLKEKLFLFSLRSYCYKAKIIFRCSLKCDSGETQLHICQSCCPILDKLDIMETLPPPYDKLYIWDPRRAKDSNIHIFIYIYFFFLQINSFRKQLQLPLEETPPPPC